MGKVGATMVKYFCDGCGKEQPKSRSLNTFSYLCHIDTYFTHKIGVYVDGERNRVSGRSESAGLCAFCYNKVLVPAVKALRDLRKEHNLSENME